MTLARLKIWNWNLLFMRGREKILVTGGTGYIGSELVKSLIKMNYCVAIIVRDTNESKKLFREDVTYILSDNSDFKKMIIEFSPNIVVHLAAYSTSSDTLEEMHKLIASNIIFTSVLLDALSACKIDLFINTGSFSEYYYNDNTLSSTYFYSATKTSAKYIVDYFSRKNNFKYINAILYTVYGKESSRKKIIDYAIDSLDCITTIQMSEGLQVLDFIHIEDVVNFYLHIIDNHGKLNLYEKDYCVGTGRGINLRELVNILEQYTNTKANIQWGANKSRLIDTKQAIANVVKTNEELGWNAKIDVYSGVIGYVDKQLGDING